MGTAGVGVCSAQTPSVRLFGLGQRSTALDSCLSRAIGRLIVHYIIQIDRVDDAGDRTSLVQATAASYGAAWEDLEGKALTSAHVSGSTVGRLAKWAISHVPPAALAQLFGALAQFKKTLD